MGRQNRNASKNRLRQDASRSRNLFEWLEIKMLLSTVSYLGGNGIWSDGHKWIDDQNANRAPADGDDVVIALAGVVTIDAAANIPAAGFKSLTVHSVAATIDLKGNSIKFTDSMRVGGALATSLIITNSQANSTPTVTTKDVLVAAANDDGTGGDVSGSLDVDKNVELVNTGKSEVGSAPPSGAQLSNGVLTVGGKITGSGTLFLGTGTAAKVGQGTFLVDGRDGGNVTYKNVQMAGTDALHLSKLTAQRSATLTLTDTTGGITLAKKSAAQVIIDQSVLNASGVYLDPVAGELENDFEIINGGSWANGKVLHVGGGARPVQGAASEARTSTVTFDHAAVQIDQVTLGNSAQGNVTFSATDSTLTLGTWNVGGFSPATATLTRCTVKDLWLLNVTGGSLTATDHTTITSQFTRLAPDPFDPNNEVFVSPSQSIVIGGSPVAGPRDGTFVLSDHSTVDAGPVFFSTASNAVVQVSGASVMKSWDGTVATTAGKKASINIDGTNTKWVLHGDINPDLRTLRLSQGGDVDLQVTGGAKIQTDYAKVADAGAVKTTKVNFTINGSEFAVLAVSPFTVGSATTDPANILLNVGTGGSITLPTGGNLLKQYATPSGTGVIYEGVTTRGIKTDISPGNQENRFGALTIQGYLDASQGMTLLSFIGYSSTLGDASNLLSVTGTVTLGSAFSGQLKTFFADGMNANLLQGNMDWTILSAGTIAGEFSDLPWQSTADDDITATAAFNGALIGQADGSFWQLLKVHHSDTSTDDLVLRYLEAAAPAITGVGTDVFNGFHDTKRLYFTLDPNYATHVAVELDERRNMGDGAQFYGNYSTIAGSDVAGLSSDANGYYIDLPLEVASSYHVRIVQWDTLGRELVSSASTITTAYPGAANIGFGVAYDSFYSAHAFSTANVDLWWAHRSSDNLYPDRWAYNDNNGGGFTQPWSVLGGFIAGSNSEFIGGDLADMTVADQAVPAVTDLAHFVTSETVALTWTINAEGLDEFSGWNTTTYNGTTLYLMAFDQLTGPVGAFDGSNATMATGLWITDPSRGSTHTLGADGSSYALATYDAMADIWTVISNHVYAPAYSAPALVRVTSYVAPANPGGIIAEMRVQWEDSNDGDAYRVERSVSGSGPWTTLADVAGRTYVDDTAVAGTWYEYRVTALGIDSALTSAARVSDAVLDTAPWSINGGTLTIAGSSGVDAVDVTTTDGVLSFTYNGQSVTPSETITAIVDKGDSTDMFVVHTLPTSVSSLAFDGGTIVLDVADESSASFGGVISGTAALMKTGAGTLILTGTNTYSGATTIAGGVLQVGDGGSTGTLGGGDVSNEGVLVFDRSGVVTVANTISGEGGVSKGGSGTVTLSGTYTDDGALAITAGRLVFAELSSSVTRQTVAVVIEISSLSIDAGATLDITNHDLVIHNGNVSSVAAAVASGATTAYDWSGTGLTSSTAGADEYAVGYGLVDDIGIGGTTWEGVTLAATDVLVKMTYFGDADLNGVVDGVDYSYFQYGYNAAVPQIYTFGDFDYSGFIDAVDYSFFMAGYGSLTPI